MKRKPIDVVIAAYLLGALLVVAWLTNSCVSDYLKAERVSDCISSGGTWTADSACEHRGAR